MPLECDYCFDPKGLLYTDMFEATVRGTATADKHKFHTELASEITPDELNFWNGYIKLFREKFGIYPENGVLEDYQSNVAFLTGCLERRGLSEVVSDCSVSLTDLLGENHITNSVVTLGDVEFRIITEGSLQSSNYLSEAIINEFFHKRNTIRDRKQDTERKLLENETREILERIFAGLDSDASVALNTAIEKKDLDGILEFTREISGNLTLYTERRACESCVSVMDLFQKLFPNINLRILEGFGDFVEYGPDGIMYPITQSEIADLRDDVAYNLAEPPDPFLTPANTFVPMQIPTTV